MCDHYRGCISIPHNHCPKHQQSTGNNTMLCNNQIKRESSPSTHTQKEKGIQVWSGFLWVHPCEFQGTVLSPLPNPASPLQQNRGGGKPDIHMSTINIHIFLVFLGNICDREWRRNGAFILVPSSSNVSTKHPLPNTNKLQESCASTQTTSLNPRQR